MSTIVNRSRCLSRSPFCCRLGLSYSLGFHISCRFRSISFRYNFKNIGDELCSCDRLCLLHVSKNITPVTKHFTIFFSSTLSGLHSTSYSPQYFRVSLIAVFFFILFWSPGVADGRPGDLRQGFGFLGCAFIRHFLLCSYQCIM
jgi:hypothetical protein